MISVDGFRYAVGGIGVDVRTLRPVNVSFDFVQRSQIASMIPASSPEWRDARLAAALEYLAALEADPDCDELTIVAAGHEVMLRRRALAKEIAQDG